MKKSFHTVKKAGILTAAAVLGTAALAGCGSKADTTESAAASEEATEAVGEAEASDAQLVIAGGDSAGLIAAVQAAAEGMDPSKILILAPGEELAADMAEMAPYVNAANTDEQFQANLTDDCEMYLSDIMTAGEEAKDWLADTLGMEYGDLTQEAGSTVARSFPAKEGNLNELVQEALLKKVEELKIPVEYKTELKSVAYDEEGALDRITVTVDGKDQEIDCLALVATDVSLIPVFEESQVYEADGKAAALVVSNNAEQLNKDSGELINGLYAAGPILSAAVDGEGVLSGNELTEAVVFGSTAGTEAAVYVSDNQ